MYLNRAPRREGDRRTRAAFWICAAGMLCFALAPATGAPGATWDKGNHVLGFAVLGSLAMNAWPRRSLRVLLALLVYGCVIEGLQSLTPARQADWLDILANAVGLLVAALLSRLMQRG